MTVATSYPWKFTNNSGKDLIMTMVSESMSSGTNGGISNYAKTMIQLIPDSQTGAAIANGSTVTFTLDWSSSYTDSSGNTTTFPAGLYLLSAITSDELIPVWTKGLAKDYEITPVGFDAVTVDSSILTAFNECFNFIQQVEAYPKSDFAKNFNAAMNTASTDGDTAGTASGNTEKMKAAVNNFFASSNSAKDVTYDIYTSTNAYINEYPFPWAVKESATYYLYSSSTTGGDSSSKSSVATYLGTATVSKPDALDWSKDLAGYTASFQAAAVPDYLLSTKTGSDKNNYNTTGATTSLGYSQGQFISNPDEDVHAITLQGLYALQSSLIGQSNKDSKEGAIIPILVGTVNGKQCIGYPNPVTGTYDDDKPGASDPFLYNLVHPKGVGGVIQSIMSIGGMVMLLDFIWGKIKGRSDKNAKDTEKAKTDAEDKGEDPKEADKTYTQEELDQAKQDAVKEYQEQLESNLDNQGLSETDVKNIASSDPEVTGNTNELNDNMANASDSLNASGKYGTTIENATQTAEKLSESGTVLEEAIESGVPVNPNDIGQLQSTANQLSESVDSANTAIDNIQKGNVIENGTSTLNNLNSAIDNLPDMTSVQETLNTATAKINESGAGIDTEELKEASQLSENLEEDVKEQKEAADSTDDVNDGSEAAEDGETVFDDI